MSSNNKCFRIVISLFWGFIITTCLIFFTTGKANVDTSFSIIVLELASYEIYFIFLRVSIRPACNTFANKSIITTCLIFFTAGKDNVDTSFSIIVRKPAGNEIYFIFLWVSIRPKCNTFANRPYYLGRQ